MVRYSFGRFSFILLKEIKMETNLTIFKGNKPTINEIIEGEILEESNIALKGKKVTEKERKNYEDEILEIESIIKKIRMNQKISFLFIPLGIIIGFGLTFFNVGWGPIVFIPLGIVFFFLNLFITPFVLFDKEKLELASNWAELKKTLTKRSFYSK